MTSMPTLYLAGPMSGIPDLNFPAFNTEAARLRGWGYHVVNPAELNKGADALVADMRPSEHAAHWRHCMKRDIQQLMTCDAIALLPGWEKSRGACLERLIADELGMPAYLVTELGIERKSIEPRPGRPIAISLRHFAMTGDELQRAEKSGVSRQASAASYIHNLARIKLLKAMGGAA